MAPQLKQVRYRNVCITQYLQTKADAKKGDGQNPSSQKPKKIFTPKELLHDYPNRFNFAIRSPVEKCPTTGKLHHHWYLEMKDQLTMKQLKEIFNDQTIHVERRKGTQQQAITYCTKDYYSEDRRQYKRDYTSLANSEELRAGVPKAQGRRSDWVMIHDEIKKGTPASVIFDMFPEKSVVFRSHIYKACSDQRRRTFAGKDRNTTTHVVYGDAGTGKDYDVYAKYGAENVYELCRDENGAVWWDGYEGQDVVLISDFKWWLTRDRLLNICGDRMIRVNCKGYCEWLTASTIVITSNYDPRTWYPDKETNVPWKGNGRMDNAFVSRLTSLTRYEYQGECERSEPPPVKVVKKQNHRKIRMKKRRRGPSITPRLLRKIKEDQKSSEKFMTKIEKAMDKLFHK